VFSLNEPGDRAYAARMTQTLGIPVERAFTAHAAVEAADVICTATNSPTPLFDGAWLRPGTHINAIGAYTRTTRELDTKTVQRSRVYVDGRQAAQAEAGDIVIPIAEGAITGDHIVGELGGLLIGQVTGRTSPDQITVFKSVGMARYINKHIEGACIPDAVIDRLMKASDKQKASVEIAGDLIRSLKPLWQGIQIIPIGWEKQIPALLDYVGL
jgi:hypothetical protein